MYNIQVIQELHDALTNAKVSVVGISGYGPECRLSWEGTPSEADIERAQAIVNTVEWNKPVLTPDESIVFISRLNPSQRQKLLDTMLVEFVQSHPRLLETL